MRGPTDFESLEIGDRVAVGATGADRVRIWVRTTRPGPHDLEIWTDREQRRGRIVLDPPAGADGTTSFCYPDDVDGGEPLAPVTPYRFRVTRGDDVLGEGRFETAPARREDTPDRFSFAVLSCHQPYEDDGRLSPRSLAMLDVLGDALRAHDVKRVLLVGDQMYSDYPKGFDLFDLDHFQRVAPRGRPTVLDCTREEVRALFQRRYRAFWAVEPFQRLLADWPCYPILDDHEIADNFGSGVEHSRPRWAALRAGALDAFHDYQGLLVRGRADGRPPEFHYHFTYGPVGVFCLDLRSQRVDDGETLQICGSDQLDALDAFLHEQADRQVILIVLSVPLMVLPDWATQAGLALAGEASDIADRWSNPKAQRDRRRLTQLLFDHQRRHPDQRIVLVGGDIHVGCVTRFDWRDREVRPVYQLASSAVSNLAPNYARILAGLASRLDKQVAGEGGEPWADVGLVDGAGAADQNPFGDLNAGIVELTRRPDGTLRVELLLLCHDGDPPHPRVVFRTEVP